MDITTLYLADNDFEQKIKELKTMLRLRMNGETSSQMNKRNLSYTINYGVALHHIKEIAGRVTFTPEECKKLWLMNIRETMLLACILLPDSSATLDEMCDWATKINTPDMAEQASFFLFGRGEETERFVSNMLSASHTYAYAIACFSAGRRLQLKHELSDDIIKSTLSQSEEKENLNSAEMRGLSLLLRQCVRHKKELSDTINATIERLKSNPSADVQRIVYEVETEIEMQSEAL